MSGLSVGQLLNRLQELSGNVVFGESRFNFFFQHLNIYVSKAVCNEIVFCSCGLASS